MINIWKVSPWKSAHNFDADAKWDREMYIYCVSILQKFDGKIMNLNKIVYICDNNEVI
jgi:hypothetical protein